MITIHHRQGRFANGGKCIEIIGDTVYMRYHSSSVMEELTNQQIEQMIRNVYTGDWIVVNDSILMDQKLEELNGQMRAF